MDGGKLDPFLELLQENRLAVDADPIIFEFDHVVLGKAVAALGAELMSGIRVLRHPGPGLCGDTRAGLAGGFPLGHAFVPDQRVQGHDSLLDQLDQLFLGNGANGPAALDIVPVHRPPSRHPL